MVPVEPSSPVIANRTFRKYQSGPRVMVPLEPSSFVSFGQLFIQFLESSWGSTGSSWCLARLQGVMVPVEPSSLRSDLVEPTKDDPELQQIKKYFWQLDIWENSVLIFWHHTILAAWYSGKITFWQNDSLAKWYFGIHTGRFAKTTQPSQ